ncbi:MAG: AraC family transcriptional regulator [Kofleriaceae bacterium]
MVQPTALASLARTAIDAARTVGMTDDQIASAIADSGVASELVDDRDGRIAVADLLHLWHVLAERSGDPFFGLHAGEHVVSARTIHVVGYAARNSSTVGECYAHTVRFASLTNEASEISCTVEGPRGSLLVGPKPGLPVWPRVYADMAISAYYSIGQRWAGVPIKPLGVTFQHDRPADVGEYERLFGCTPQFNAPKNRLILPASAFALPLNAIDPDLLAYFADKASELLDSSSSATLELRVREAIAKALGNSAPTIAAIARRLALSTRTLQRRLAEDGLQFASLVDDVRRIHAIRLMAARDADIAMVAFRVGYRDLDAFRAAFQRWTGKTPRAFRQDA